jgi:hypothetical protein
MGVTASPGMLYSVKEIRYPSTAGAFVSVGRISRLPGFESRTSTPVMSLYTDYAKVDGDNIKMDVKEIVTMWTRFNGYKVT